MATFKVIIVTGASRGIGLAVANYLFALKCHKLVLVARSPQPLQAFQNQDPASIETVSADMAELGVGKEVIAQALRRFGRLDGLVVNHGMLDPVQKVSDSKVEDWRNAFEVNFFSAIDLIQAALPALRQSKGRIILTSSGAATSAYSTWGAYGASKAALNHLGMTLATEEPDIITIAIRPGTVDTEMQRELREVHNKAMDPKDAEKFSELKTSGKLLKPEQPGNVIARLVLDATVGLSGKFITWNDKELGEFQDS